MTVDADQQNRWEYTGDASDDTFPYTSKIFASSDLKVYLAGAVQSTGYTVTGVGDDDGGDVVFDDPPAVGVAVTILREVPDKQPTEFPLGGRLSSVALEQELDRRTIVSQQNATLRTQTLRYNPADQDIPDGVLPSLATLKGKLLKFHDDDGSPTVIALADITALEISSVGDGLEISGSTIQVDRHGTSLRTSAGGVAVQIPVSERSTNLTINNTDAADQGKLLACTGTFTITLPDSTTIGNTYVHFYVANVGSGVVTLSRSGSDVINAAETTWAIRSGESVAVVLDGINANWYVLYGRALDLDNDTYWTSPNDDEADLVVGGTTVIHATASAVELGADAVPVDFQGKQQRDGLDLVVGVLFDETTIITNAASYAAFWDNANGYSRIEIYVSRLRPDADAVLILRTSTDGGSNYDSGATSYAWAVHRVVSSAGTSESDDSDSEIQLSGTVTLESTDGSCADFKITINDPGNADANTSMFWQGFWLGGGGNYNSVIGGGQRLSAADVNGIQLSFVGQNIAEGQIRVIGYRT